MAMKRSILKLLDDFANPGGSDEQSEWRPAADVYRTSNGWLVKFDLAGVNPTEINISRCHRRLTIRGVRRDAVLEHGCCSYSLEINYNRFERSVDLPVEIDQFNLTSEYRDGMLLVWLTSTPR